MYVLEPGDPRRMGEFTLVGRLGAGGMGQVFLGRSAAGRTVAVKVVRPALADVPEFRARFRQEGCREPSSVFVTVGRDGRLLLFSMDADAEPGEYVRKT